MFAYTPGTWGVTGARSLTAPPLGKRGAPSPSWGETRAGKTPSSSQTSFPARPFGHLATT